MCLIKYTKSLVLGWEIGNTDILILNILEVLRLVHVLPLLLFLHVSMLPLTAIERQRSLQSELSLKLSNILFLMRIFSPERKKG